jgi:hypothetical protein
MATLAAPTRTETATAPVADRSAAVDRSWHTWAVVIAAVAVNVGVYWDISWHMSIGRDTFWTPAHMLIQSGGILAGVSSGIIALKSTFFASDRELRTGVRLWGFRAPLGAWVCIWGCFAMLASAPFDNWWHDAYGLDVRIISPPHTVLALGIFAIVNGALLASLAQQNRSDERRRPLFTAMYLVAGAMLMMNFVTFLTESSLRYLQHDAYFYRISAEVYPFGLVALSRAGKSRWSATISAGVCMALMLSMMWIVQLFPATPKLGPIYQNITHFVGMAWPVWIVIPATGIDYVRHRLGDRLPAIVEAVILGALFVVLFAAVQWPWSSFMVESQLARNAFFNADNWVYWATPGYVDRAHHFPPSQGHFASAAIVTLLIASISSLLGLGWGRWMSRVQR